jgi:cytochrome c-type biogenesis protein CcmH
MAGWEFWAVAICLTAAASVVLIEAMRRGQAGESPAEADLAVYKDQLAEIERDLQRGTIGTEEAGRLRTEVGRRVLEADRARAAGTKTATRSGRSMLGILVILSVVPTALSAYWSLGAPGYRDLALAPRLAALDAGIAGRPLQAERLAAIGQPRDVAKDADLVAALEKITLVGELRGLFRKRMQNGEYLAAIRTQERLITVLGKAAGSGDHANLALALALEADSYVSPEAEAALRQSLTLDMTNEVSRYLVGEMFLQGGRFDQAFTFWRPIAEGGNPAAPWVISIRERIEAVAELAGVRYALPEAEASEDTQAMIEGMVAQLSDRLASDGGPVEDWEKLIRSLGVLGRKDQAQAIYDEAKGKFAGREAELATLAEVAGEAGLTP